MATINKIQLPNGNEYDLTDSRIGSTAIGNASAPVYWDGTKFAATTSISMDDKADLVDGKVPATQLPSYVDDVIEGASLSALPEKGEAGKIYVTLDTNKTYRWSGSAYVEISASLAIGTTATTAAAGNHTHSGYVPTTRKINDKALDSDITLDASDVNAIPVVEGGEVGQVLTKTESGYEWTTVESDDTKVTQSASTENKVLPVLIAKSENESTDTALFSNNVTINPSNGEMNATQFALNGRVIIASETATGGWLWS